MLVYIYRYGMNEANSGSGKEAINAGSLYFSSMVDQDAKKRYLEKLGGAGGVDPYQTRRRSEKTMWTCDLA